MSKFATKLKLKVRKRRASAIIPEDGTGGGGDTAAAAAAAEEEEAKAEWTDHTKDLTRIRLRNVNYEYQNGGGHHGGVPILMQMNANIPLGASVLVQGAGAASGTRTFMKLLARSLYPTNGCLDIPAHLKVG
jgi:ABC-type siderophore export system fused ATPase/permease subunit